LRPKTSMITRLSPALVTAQSPAPTLRGLREPRQLLRNGLGGQQLLIQCAHAPESAAIRPGSRPEGAAGQETDQPELTALSQARRLYVSTSNLLDEACDLPSIVGGPLNWLQDNEGLRDSCEAGKQLRVAVLLSGGVDSSLALQLLHAAGHQVKAFYLQIWFQEDFRNFWDACPWEEDLHYAQEVCRQALQVLGSCGSVSVRGLLCTASPFSTDCAVQGDCSIRTWWASVENHVTARCPSNSGVRYLGSRAGGCPAHHRILGQSGQLLGGGSPSRSHPQPRCPLQQPGQVWGVL